jgi:DNA-directed RNA polymerase subunit RPC12/RpoP
MNVKCNECGNEFTVDEGLLESLRKGPENITGRDEVADTPEEPITHCPHCGSAYPLDSLKA